MILMIEHGTSLDDIDLSEDALFQRAVDDCFTAFLRRATVGRSMHDATVQLEWWRRKFEERTRR